MRLILIGVQGVTLIGFASLIIRMIAQQQTSFNKISYTAGELSPVILRFLCSEERTPVWQRYGAKTKYSNKHSQYLLSAMVTCKRCEPSVPILRCIISRHTESLAA